MRFIKTNQLRVNRIVIAVSYPVEYNSMDILQTAYFSSWFSKLKDKKAKACIQMRIDRAEDGNFGDHKFVGVGVLEMRIDYGPGYRVYYTLRGGLLIILLAGGDKSSQEKDIRKAQALAKKL